MPLENYLTQNQLIDPAFLAAAKMEQSATGDDLGGVLIRNGFISQSKLMQVRLKIDKSGLARDRVFSQTIPYQALIKTKSILTAESDDAIYVASIMPEAYVTSVLSEHDTRKIFFVPLCITDLESYHSDLKRIHAQDDDSFVERIIRDAIHQGISDIHIIPRNKTFTIMFRHLGVRRIAHEGLIDDYYTIAARIKDNSRMDLSERRIPQSGGFQVEHRNIMVDLRVESLPTSDGEYIVIRLLNPDNTNVNLSNIGITRVDDWKKGVGRRSGLCLVCGPTGSGKTTTLNATIREMDRFGRAIFTAEDPVEYTIPYVGQVSINNSVDLTFSRALRSFMRTDPDVIIIGEVRDLETAQNMLRAAETGHLVIATLHTESIINAIARLKDIGVSPSDLKHLLRAVLVQSLIRTTCQDCGGVGCPECFGSGYSGRTIVSECAYFHDERDTERLFKEERWWQSMAEDAVDKYKEGRTTREELIRTFSGEAEYILAQDGLDTQNNTE